MDWHFFDTGYQPGALNMEIDETLVRTLAEGDGHPTLRVYGWNPPAISLGWNQRLGDIDSGKAAADGIDIVRRPTGGRAILHSDEVTYSVTMESEGKNVLATYNDISRALVHGLNKLGAAVSLEKSQPHFPTLYRAPSSAVCFSSSARYEIQCEGRKLVGSAQRRYASDTGRDVILQHGSVLLGGDHKRLVRYLKLASDDDRERLACEMEEKTTDLATVLGRRVTFAEVAAAIRSGFEEAWGIALKTIHLEPMIAGQTV